MRHTIVGAALAMVLAAPSVSEAQWRWLDKLSGPGPFGGLTAEVKLLCSYDGRRTEAPGAANLIGAAISAPCLGPLTNEKAAAEMGAKNRKWVLGIAAGLSASFGNELTYERSAPDGDRRVLNIPIELFFERNFETFDRRLTAGAFVGTHLFRGRLVGGDTLIPRMWKGVIGAQGSVRLVYLGPDPHYAAIRLRAGAILYAGGFDVHDFGAVGNWPERDGPSSGREIIPFVGLVFDLDRWK
jgi:hypothetical protein